MKEKTLYTSGDLAREYGLALWQVREVLDSLPSAMIVRAGLYRLLPRRFLPRFERALTERGLLEPAIAT